LPNRGRLASRGRVFAALGLMGEIAGHVVAWPSQNRLSGLLITVAPALARFWFMRLQAAKT
jgi:hypothetical protein